MHTLLLCPAIYGVGLTSIGLGLIRAFDIAGYRATFFKPFNQPERNGPGVDKSRALAANVLQQDLPDSMPQAVLENYLADDRLEDLLEQLVSTQREQQAQGYDVLIVEGLAPTGRSSYAPQINAAMAQALDAQVILIATAEMSQLDGLGSLLESAAQPFGGMGSNRTIGVILNQVKGIAAPSPKVLQAARTQLTQHLQQTAAHFGTERFALLGLIPYDATLARVRTADIAQTLAATLIYPGEASRRRVERVTLCARTVRNILNALTPGTLIVTPGDRDDILVASALAALNGVPLAGVVLTGGLQPEADILRLCHTALQSGLPVMVTPLDSFHTVQAITQMGVDIPMDDLERAEALMTQVADHLEMGWIRQMSSRQVSTRLSPSAFRYELVRKASAQRRRIVLPEGSEPRTVQAAIICQSRGIADCILLAKPQEVQEVAQARGLTLPAGLQVIDPDTIRRQYVQPMVARRPGKLTEPVAEAQLQDTVVLGTMMLAQGEVDGLVSGAIHTTANTVRPAFQLIKTAPGFSLVSSIFFMLLPEQVVVYGDCAINPEPDAAQLAEIAIQSADSAAAFGIVPRVAMLSYSTGESGSGAEVDKVREATRIARERRPDLSIDGPLQYDAAAIESVGRQKAPNSPVAGQATVFVFPDLNTGNTTYKAVQRSARVVSVGPMLQGLNKPVNDLSRGALVDDIVFTIALTAVQANQAVAGPLPLPAGNTEAPTV